MSAAARDSVLVATPQVVYVLLASRAEIDKVNAPQEGDARCIVKRVEGEVGVTVIFQHWLQ